MWFWTSLMRCFRSECWQWQLCQRMADEFCLNSVISVERLFEGEDHQHPANVVLDKLDAVLLPRPQLRAYEEDNWNAQAMEFLCEPEVDFRKIDEHGNVGPAGADCLFQLAEFAGDAGQGGGY